MITYKIGNNIYINLTNRCSNNCNFCVRINDSYKDYGLWLDKEPTAEEVINELGDIKDIDEVVFCGYGEPLYRLDAILKISEYAHTLGKRTRLNTNGQSEGICGKNVAPMLKGYIDTVSISLNASDKVKYQAICHSEFGEKSFDMLCDFAKECNKCIPKVIMSIVDVVGKDEIEKAGKVAENLGVDFRVREYIP